MDKKTPEWVFDQDEDVIEKKGESSSSPIVEKEKIIAKNEDKNITSDEVVIEKSDNPVWEEETTVFEEEVKTTTFNKKQHTEELEEDATKEDKPNFRTEKDNSDRKYVPIKQKQGKKVANSTFEASGWDMFGNEDIVIPKEEAPAPATKVETELKTKITPVIEQNDNKPPFEKNEEEVKNIFGEESAFSTVGDLNSEVEDMISSAENTEDEDLNKNDGSINSEDVFEKSKLVLKRDETSTQTSIVEETVSDGDENYYVKILSILEESEDLGLTPATRQKVRDAINSDIIPQISIKELISQRVIGKIQLARAATRSQGHQEIMSFLDIPAEAAMLRKEIDPKAVAYLREHRIIPIRRETSAQGENALNLAYESVFRDLVKESDLRELLPGYNFYWHFALREVCGAFWLAGGDDDVDSGMEAEALLDRIVTNAIDARSSDIHIDPSIKGEPRAVVKYRIDGFVTPKEVITQDQLERLKVRIENIARMPTVNQNHPNKGAFSRAGFDWRVQIQPHAGRYGPVPRIVIRRLQPDVLPMEDLGYPEYFIDDIKSAANSPNGVVFWTGPTGSGKTESIHSAIVSVNPMGKGLSVHTIEDPPEKRVSGYAVQMELSDQDPLRTGAELLKSTLRADPDVVIFGEVRDKEMAGLVFEAANTGHLVFSTLHTNTALDAIVRLDELGIYGFLISYIRGIASQRLVRRLCVHCRHSLNEIDEFTKSIFDKYEVDTDGAVLYKANAEGCISCNHSGYHGRIAICEWLTPSQELVELSARRDYDDLERVATASGWKPMAYMGVLHIKNGITDAEELASKVLELSAEV